MFSVLLSELGGPLLFLSKALIVAFALFHSLRQSLMGQSLAVENRRMLVASGGDNRAK